MSSLRFQIAVVTGTRSPLTMSRWTSANAAGAADNVVASALLNSGVATDGWSEFPFMAKTITQSVWGCLLVGRLQSLRLTCCATRSPDRRADESNVQRLAALCDKMHHVVSTLRS